MRRAVQSFSQVRHQRPTWAATPVNNHCRRIPRRGNASTLLLHGDPPRTVRPRRSVIRTTMQWVRLHGCRKPMVLQDFHPSRIVRPVSRCWLRACLAPRGRPLHPRDSVARARQQKARAQHARRGGCQAFLHMGLAFLFRSPFRLKLAVCRYRRDCTCSATARIVDPRRRLPGFRSELVEPGQGDCISSAA